MLFNSIVFIFAYLPAVLVGYYLICASPIRRVRMWFLAAASLFFYGYWAPKYVLLLLFSMTVNYLLGMAIRHYREHEHLRRGSVLAGLLFNLSLLFYFKYFNFFIDNLNHLPGVQIEVGKILLPLAISFFTFQKIAFLFDLYRRRVTLGSVGDYAAFVLFFPQLIAGPIVHYSELAPQLKLSPKLNATFRHILIGMILFGIGLFKKTVLADTFALYASPIFNASAAGTSPGFVGAWTAAFIYTLQIYFDFSGYSDMAIGLARMFGVWLPLNFHSPLRSNNMAELWRRWHMTLSRFVQNYIFQPIQVPMTRFAAERTRSRLGMFAVSTLAPTFLSMVIIGVWHGAGWNFLIFGVLHGAYVCSTELWTHLRRRKRKKGVERPQYQIVFARILTVTAFVFATVPFRAKNVGVTMEFFRDMLLPFTRSDRAFDWQAAVPFGATGAVAAAVVGYAIVSLLPNTQQFMTRVEPALEWPKWSKVDTPPVRIAWRPTPAWICAAAAFFFLGVAFIMRGTTEFIYFNF
ncbi:MAG: MBOAT family protein [Phenylobacterium sp.]|uniref:MBOAT family O-acyltransferase n=1 Tax=Phenylobacterium sp. TaxID=1871053 RepID=UPI0025E44B36|nr:MBOAT family O-acyltransferase [Phenylobacterium sp.]MBI1198456.1 MBOAT family protein [Phenylobacterium sp.]